MQADDERPQKGGELRAKNTAKKIEKLFKNLLTNGKRCGIIIKSRKTRRCERKFARIIDN